MTKEQIIKQYELLYDRIEEYAGKNTPAVMDNFIAIIETIATNEKMDFTKIQKYCKNFEYKNNRIVGNRYV